MKVDLKGEAGIDTSTLPSKADSASLKTKVDNLDVDKLTTVPAELSNLSNIVDNDVVKKTVYDKLIIKVNAIDTKGPSTNRWSLKHCMIYTNEKEKEIEDVDKKTPNTVRLVKKTACNTKITEIEKEVPNITGLVTAATTVNTTATEILLLATKAALNTKTTEGERKIPDIINLTTKAALNTKLQRWKTKCLIPQILLVTLNLID